MQASWIFFGLAVLAGACLSVQAGINAQLRVVVADPLLAGLVSFVTGTVLMVVVVLLFSPNRFNSETPWAHIAGYKYLGGVIGATYITAVVLLAPKLGASSMFALVVVGQFAMAVVLDHFGWLGFTVHHATWQRLLGIVLLLLGVTLVVRY